MTSFLDEPAVERIFNRLGHAAEVHIFGYDSGIVEAKLFRPGSEPLLVQDRSLRGALETLEARMDGETVQA